MAEPESAVLPITPYPIGCLKLLLRAGFASYYQPAEPALRAVVGLFKPECRVPKI
jgi:hypothetical protein